ncbi:hypothetical protein C2S52_011903 [Perilla frutescens var. hirtella]|nr:hypothetical protein C2S52_011903 [Perilla frutescens var. hirtella]KAH6785483.1 hypothetical protein C2S51_037938 [Perilla frutescens var. frutescens]
MSSQPTPSPPPSPSPRRLVSDDDKLTPPSPAKPDLPSESPPPRPSQPRTPVFPSREDCWSEEGTRTLIEAWGAHYLHLNRGNLRQKDWQEVADAVNAASAKLRRTDVQCKNRIDTTKKKYKVEKSKVVQSNGRYVSTWPHFQSLDALIGDSFTKTQNTAAAAANANTVNAHNKNLRRRISAPPEHSPSPSQSPEKVAYNRKISPASDRRDKDPATSHPLGLPWSVPVGPRSKRSAPGSVTERNFSVMAAAAAAMEAEEDEEDDNYNYNNDDDDEGCRALVVRRRRRRPAAAGRKRKGREEGAGYRMLAEAIMRLGEIYEKVEVAKQRQMMEFEKQRMQFAKDLELLRSQVQLDNLKRAKFNSQTSKSSNLSAFLTSVMCFCFLDSFMIAHLLPFTFEDRVQMYGFVEIFHFFCLHPDQLICRFENI